MISDKPVILRRKKILLMETLPLQTITVSLWYLTRFYLLLTKYLDKPRLKKLKQKLRPFSFSCYLLKHIFVTSNDYKGL